VIEIELNESARRRRDELRAKLDALAEAPTGEASSEDDLEARQRELKILTTSIEAAQKRVNGAPVVYSLTELIFPLTLPH
jgi:structural maintenance of chromosome 3 (chondroitin sulfate proteoglycan 6)